MALTCPWNIPTTTAHASSASRSPTLQEIMDEALARQLYEQDCRAIAIEDTADVFSDLETKATDRSLYSAESDIDFDSDDTDFDNDFDFGLRPVPRAIATTKQRFDRPVSVEGAQQGLNSIRESFRRWEKEERHGGGSGGRVEASTFATQDAVLDTRTVRLLQKLINRGDVDEVHGCVQTGKEANVYFAVGTDPDSGRTRHLAIKIFKTTLGGFSNRKDYILGDRRFDLAFHKKDKRRQINEWSEKEFRNLNRAAKCIRAPTPFAIKDHVVVMQFIGDATEGLSAPTLKEVAANMTASQLVHAYTDVMASIFGLMHDAKLVHGDLSEYNVLYHKHKCWIIDFGQAVGHTHPQFFEYLRRDLETVHRFFAKYGLVAAEVAEADGLVGLMSVEEAFEWITSKDDHDAVIADYPQLRAMLHAKQ